MLEKYVTTFGSFFHHDHTQPVQWLNIIFGNIEIEKKKLEEDAHKGS